MFSRILETELVNNFLELVNNVRPFVSLSLVTTIGVAAPNVAAAAIAATAGGLVGMLHMLKNATAVCGS